MNSLKKALASLASQIKKPDVTLPSIEIPHKITDDNQSINNGVINEEFHNRMRSEIESPAKRKRGRPKSKRED
jgi:hypothetical protein